MELKWGQRLELVASQASRVSLAGLSSTVRVEWPVLAKWGIQLQKVTGWAKGC